MIINMVSKPLIGFKVKAGKLLEHRNISVRITGSWYFED